MQLHAIYELGFPWDDVPLVDCISWKIKDDKRRISGKKKERGQKGHHTEEVG